MQPRIDLRKTAPGAIQAMLGLQNYVNTSGLPPTLLELVKIRASQINACAYCLDMHTQDARANGETEQRLYALNAWRENPVLQRSRTRRASLDRIPDSAPRRPRSR